jgi:hypothetical protein
VEDVIVRKTAACVFSGLAVATLFACDLRIDPAALRVVEKQESSRHDEPYLGVVRFESEFGRPDSTEVTFSGTKVKLPPAEAGEMVDVPNDLADLLTFPDFPVRSEATVGEGVSIAGAVIVAMENDDFGWDPVGGDGVKASLRDTRACLEDALRAQVETRAYSDGNLLLALQGVRSHLEAQCPGQGGLSGLEKVLVNLLQLFGRSPDDLMGSVFLVQVGVDPDYFDSAFGGLLPCRPFLTNPDQVARGGRFDSSRVASICPVAPGPRVLVPWFERAGGRPGRWELRTVIRYDRSVAP